MNKRKKRAEKAVLHEYMLKLFATLTGGRGINFASIEEWMLDIGVSRKDIKRLRKTHKSETRRILAIGYEHGRTAYARGLPRDTDDDPKKIGDPFLAGYLFGYDQAREERQRANHSIN